MTPAGRETEFLHSCARFRRGEGRFAVATFARKAMPENHHLLRGRRNRLLHPGFTRFRAHDPSMLRADEWRSREGSREIALSFLTGCRSRSSPVG